MNRTWILAVVAVLVLGGIALTLLTRAPGFLPETGLANLTADHIATLSSLEKVDDYPVYVMHYVGSYAPENFAQRADPKFVASSIPEWVSDSPFACSLFAAGTEEQPLFARNFDWHYHPFLVLYTDPPFGYASVSLVDLTYFVSDDIIERLDEIPLEERAGLLGTPHVPFDGMNDQGLAIGMAALSGSLLPADPDKETVGSIEIIRRVLDTTASVDEAIQLMESVNIFDEGPPIHYFLADAAGKSAIVEYGDGDVHVFSTDEPWLQMTNFRLHEVPESERDVTCWRYSTISQQLEAVEGQVSPEAAMGILEAVQQSNEAKSMGTLWSAVYDLRARSVDLVVDADYEKALTLKLP